MKTAQRYAGILMTVIFSLPAANYRLMGAQNEKFVTEKIMDGLLLNVDRNAKLISVRGPDQKESMFNYNDDIRVISPDRTMQGLVGRPGAQVRIR